jgi:hypothetical protein
MIAQLAKTCLPSMDSSVHYSIHNSPPLCPNLSRYMYVCMYVCTYVPVSLFPVHLCRQPSAVSRSVPVLPCHPSGLWVLAGVAVSTSGRFLSNIQWHYMKRYFPRTILLLAFKLYSTAVWAGELVTSSHSVPRTLERPNGFRDALRRYHCNVVCTIM